MRTEYRRATLGGRCTRLTACATADGHTHTSSEAERGAAEALEKVILGDLFQAVPSNKTWNSFSVQ
jgi:hypothetical protein